MFTISFTYDEASRKWEVFATGAKSEVEALQGFNAVVISCEDVIPEVKANRAKLLPDGRYEISIGQR